MTTKFGATGQGLVCEEIGDNAGRSILVPDFPTSSTVQQLKDAVAREMGLRTSGQSFVLFFGGQAMEEDSRPLAQYQVKNGDTIFFVRSIDPTAEDAPPPYQGAPGADEKMAIKTISTLFVKTVDGRNLVLENLAITMKVSELREKIRSEKYIDVAGVRILFGGKELEDRMSLMDYNLGNESTVHIVYQVHGGHI